MFPSNIVTCLLLALSIGWSSAQNLPSIAEVDLLFPTNDTYAPTVLMPLVIGIQNPSAAVPLHLGLRWNLFQLDGGNVTGLGVIPETYYIPPGARQYYEYSSFYDLTTTEGTWLLQWTVDSVNCSQFPANNYSMGSYTQGNRIIFTTKNGAQAPDLVTATADDVCASAQGFTFNVTGLEKASVRSPDNVDGKDSVTTCAVVAPMSPTYRPNPCAAQLNATGASSISLALTTSACGLPSSVVSCPAKSVGSLRDQLGEQIWAVASFGWLLYSLARNTSSMWRPEGRFDIWGQCGTTPEFCVNTYTGSPGTAAPGTNGCISNCGTNIISGDAPALWRTVAYFEGFGLDRACLYQDALQIDASAYTNLHFGFAVLNSDYSVDSTFGGDQLTAFEFSQFLRVSGAARILSFGGWDFSTDPSTYMIFRSGVTSANAETMATNMANFIIENNLDGIDIDWEYPGAPDIPGIPPASSDDGANFLAFLAILKAMLPNQTVSITAPSSYWYLQHYPIQEIAGVIDYIILMTYDLHGQWDASNSYSQDGCVTGNCLRSDVNLTETLNSLSMITKAGVPSSQVIVGVTSYGRSFEMSDASCWTEDCTFTGSSSQSNAEEGPCTATAGILANAEIQSILQNATRVNQNYIDEASNTNILVYYDVQWVGYMDDALKASRKSLYQSLNMGGSADWATDLEAYNNVPYPATSWPEFISDIRIGQVLFSGSENITGNWTSVQCTDPAVNFWVQDQMSAQQRWREMDGDDAWADITDQWLNVDQPSGEVTFIASIVNSIHGPELTDCESIGPINNCQMTEQCWFDTAGSDGSPAAGAVSYEIFNSLVMVHEMYEDVWDALWTAAAIFEPSLTEFETSFAPVPPQPDNTWLQILLDFVSLGATAVAAPFFNGFLSELPYFVANEATSDTVKDVTYAAIAAGVVVGKDIVAGQTTIGSWTVDDQNAFSTYMGQVVGAWANLTDLALQELLSGDSASLPNLDTLITGGKLIAGMPEKDNFPPDQENLTVSIASAFYAYAIPTIWSAAGYDVFVIDSGVSCGTVNPITQYMTTEDQEASGACYPENTGELYYLAMPVTSQFMPNCGSNPPDGRCPEVPFTAPPGLSTLTGGPWGGVTVQSLIQGAVRSYQSNNNANGGVVANLGAEEILDDLINQDYTTPGFINIPVCTPEMAQTAVEAGNTASANYPCAVVPSPNDCGTSTFTDATSDGSPLVTDCQQIVTNIAGTQGSWEVESSVGEQHQLVQYGTCAFGVTGTTGTGDVDFNVGAQDIVDLITSSIQMFASDGLVGASGNMACQGDAGNDNVNWGLYHT